MSEIYDDAPSVDPAFDDGQVEGDVGESSFSEEPVDYFPVDEYGDKYVRVTVDGEELSVPLKEAIGGYQRQADYTRKTQEIAEQRKQMQFAATIQQALDNDPQRTIELLKDHYGINQQEQLPEDDIFMDPWERQYRDLESRVRSFEEQQSMNELERTLNSLQQKYGEDFNPSEVVSAALAMGTDNLEGVYKQIAFDRLVNNRQLQQQQAVQKEQQIREAKRAANVVSGSSGAASASNISAGITSLREAYDLAKKDLGIS
jgi:hypothetical protein